MSKDCIPIKEIQFVSCPNLAEFINITAITQIHIGLTGVEVQFSKREGPNRWPDNITPGWQGPLQYSLGMAYVVNNKWYGSAPIETWYGHNIIGGPIQAQNVDNTGKGQITLNWFYDSRWNPLNTYNPKQGDLLIMFVVAGDCRNNYNPIRERSNLVFVTLPAPDEEAFFNYGDDKIMISSFGPVVQTIPCNWQVVQQPNNKVTLVDVGSQAVVSINADGALAPVAPGTINDTTLAVISGDYAIYNPSGKQWALLIVK